MASAPSRRPRLSAAGDLRPRPLGARRGSRRVDAPGHVFSRIHVDDIGTAIIASFARGEPGIYHLADAEPAPSRTVVEYACDLAGLSYPPSIAPDNPLLSPMARSFYAGSRRIAATKASRHLGFIPAWPDFRAGLRACRD